MPTFHASCGVRVIGDKANVSSRGYQSVVTIIVCTGRDLPVGCAECVVICVERNGIAFVRCAHVAATKTSKVSCTHHLKKGSGWLTSDARREPLASLRLKAKQAFVLLYL